MFKAPASPPRTLERARGARVAASLALAEETKVLEMHAGRRWQAGLRMQHYELIGAFRVIRPPICCCVRGASIMTAL